MNETQKTAKTAYCIFASNVHQSQPTISKGVKPVAHREIQESHS